MRIKIIISITTFVLGGFLMNAQETLPIYSDYLSDNVYLIHPAAAGIGNCGKVRLTARTQWEGNSLQTLSFHNRLGENAAVGAIAFNDENGFHSQQGIVGTYAYHINLGHIDDANQLSFGLSVMLVQNSVDESSFLIPDPAITQIVQSRNYVNSDFGMAYHNGGFFSYFTAKNLLLSARNLYSDRYESLNLRRYLVTAGYYFGNEKSIQFEPSVMAQLIERTGEKFVDVNLKAYKKFDQAQAWVGFSYRQGFDGNNIEELRYLTPIVGVNFGKYMASYTYTKQSGDFLFEDAGYHQVSLGMNFGCRTPRAAGCPNINAAFN
jgi:type IX secretion system PorP/SprF family membrane protein